MRTRKIGIDGDALRLPLAGVGQYILNICHALEKGLPDAEFFVYSRLARSGLELPSSRWKLRNETVDTFKHLPSFVWLKTRGRSMCLADRLDVFWAGRTIHPGLPRPVQTVCTVHDINHLLVPETMEPSARWSHRLWFKRDLMSATHIVANSHGTAERINSAFRLPVQYIVTPGLAAHFRDASRRAINPKTLQRLTELGIRPPYLLSVATLEPRKNVATLLRAYLDLKKSGALPGHQLVLAGARGWRNHALERELAASKDQGVLLAGYVDDDLMPALYAAADALIFPSLYEGFGMPVLEARACGTRVVVSDVPELRESGGSNAIIVKPTIAGVRAGILEAIASPLIAEEHLHDQYSWPVVAAPLLRLLAGSPC
jgi:glycosyltransferase involved in cell wall biosynthesis